MTPAEIASARIVLDHYVLCEPDVRQAIRDEAWLGGQKIGFLQEFEDAVKCLDLVLRRVLDSKLVRSA